MDLVPPRQHEIAARALNTSVLSQASRVFPKHPLMLDFILSGLLLSFDPAAFASRCLRDCLNYDNVC